MLDALVKTGEKFKTGEVSNSTESIEKFSKKGYNDDKDNSPLSTENRADTKNPTVNRWVYNAKIFSVEENKLFHQKIE